MKYGLVLSIGMLTCCGTRAAAGAGSPAKPNVLRICIDDLKPLLDCCADSVMNSPNIDRLAARGVLFESGSCNPAVCAPSRNALLTGLRSQTRGIYDLGTNFRKSRPDAITLPRCFKQHGCRTEGLGKNFHVGHGNHEDSASWSALHFHAKSIGYALKENLAENTREAAFFDNKSPANLPKGAVDDSAHGDGELTREELLANHPDRDEAPQRFAAFDSDRNGILSREEFITSGKPKN
jgi:iduronate 2-sulfatase